MVVVWTGAVEGGISDLTYWLDIISVKETDFCTFKYLMKCLFHTPHVYGEGDGL